ncbi:hypothetical protein JAAARDRAFT_195860 [Jaapia argillacea MUCL 33604]|uniref:AAA+ ATPase domain-containing protein n=1 Tax=Jaapia argillacea MUCL 33604 TaxID=933084 RepID=A0A067PNU8_9AGAM|nr:hypothetical protein JAAARDRAFT_195860 [Jaapia argillacea MUCL 33604]
MPPFSSSQSSGSKPNKRLKPTSLRTTNLNSVRNDAGPPSKKFKPMPSLSQPPKFIVPGNSNLLSSSQSNVKGKGKEKATSTSRAQGNENDQLWIDMYEPTAEEDLAVHKRKIENVRSWLNEALDGGPGGRLKAYRRILALTGAAGTGKTATIRVLARELNLEILEWKNTVDESFAGDDDHDDEQGQSSWRNQDYEGLMQKFQAFITRASTCRSLFSGPPPQSQSEAKPSTKTSSTSSPQLNTSSKRRIILLEDLPNILHSGTQQQFHAVLETVAHSRDLTPVVLIVSDSGVRGEASDDRMASGRGRVKETVDIRTALPSSLLGSQWVTEIKFNPIASTLMTRALQSMLTSLSSSSLQHPSKETLDMVVESSNGDIRSAIMALQFACGARQPSFEPQGKKRKKGTTGNSRALLEAVTRREQSLALFHLMGKVLYNKRKGDPPGSSATKKDIQRDKELDAKIKDPPPLPSHLQLHDRRSSRVDIDAIYGDSPIDSSLYSLYIHQNYTQFCNEVDESEAISEWLSWVDYSGGEAWYQANPHRFHLLTMGTLHSLPSPVTRRSQKIFKPEFFDVLSKHRECEDAVEDVLEWTRDASQHTNLLGGFSRSEVATELGGVLKALDLTGRHTVPPSHRRFSLLPFVKQTNSTGIALNEDDAGATEAPDDVPTPPRRASSVDRSRESGGWLEEDDIEDF